MFGSPIAPPGQQIVPGYDRVSSLPDAMPSKCHCFSNARCVENSAKLFVVGGYLGMRMGV
jgi:hypothetical protein